MYAQQPLQNPSQAGNATGAPQQAARIVQETVMRLKDLDVRLEALNQDLAVLCDTLGNPQAAQLARTPRQSFAPNIVAGQIGQGVSPHIAPNQYLTGAPPTHWAAQATPFAGQQPIAPSAFAPSPYAVAQANQGVQIPAFGANPYAVAQPNQGAQIPAFGASPYAVAQANQGAQVPAFAPSPFAPETSWAVQGPAFAPNPYAAPHLSGAPAAVNWAGALPPVLASPQTLSNPYANVAPGTFNPAGLVDPQQAAVGFQAAPWNVPQDPRASIGRSGFAGAPGQGFQAPLGNMNR